MDIGAGQVDSGAGGANAGEVDVIGDNLFARQMAATFGQDLIFDVECGDVGANVLIDCLGYCYGAWSSGYVISSEGTCTVCEGRSVKGLGPKLPS